MPPIRTPIPPRAPSRPRLSLRLAPPRPAGSTGLDRVQTRHGAPLPPFVRWDEFYSSWRWEQGQHVFVAGPTGSGKTVLARYLLRRRAWVVVLGVKNRDPELYAPFQAEGYNLERTFDPHPDEDHPIKVLFAPTSQAEDVDDEWAEKHAKFKAALNGIRHAGGWTVYADDIMFMSKQLRLRSSFDALWQIARSEGVSLVASSQEPVDVPPMAYTNASHLFLFKVLDRRRAERVGEQSGVNRDVVQETVLRLPKHEFLYVSKDTGRMVRSSVIRRETP